MKRLGLLFALGLVLVGCTATVQSDLGDKPMPSATPSAKASASPGAKASAAP